MRLKLTKGSRISPHLNKCCLLLVGNESFANAEKDLELLTGIKIPQSTQHRLINNYQLPEPIVRKRGQVLSVDGGSVRIRTPQGQSSEWRNYKAIKIHDRVGIAFFQDNQGLLQWVARQPLSKIINCLGAAHELKSLEHSGIKKMCLKC